MIHNQLHVLFGVFMGILIAFALPKARATNTLPKAQDELGVRADLSGFPETKLSMPPPAKDGKIPTLNKTGFMTQDHDPYSLQFINYASTCELPVLEIGAAYGITTIPALEKGATVVANDIDPNHLLILRKRTPATLRKNLFLDAHSFPSETNFPDNSFSAILICRVMHLFTPEQMEMALDKIHQWLVPGGKIYITTMSPFHHDLKNFQFEYDRRWNEGNKWPGEINNLKEVLNTIKDDIPDYAHVMDHRPLIKALEKRSFRIEAYSYYDYKRPNQQSRTGKEYFGIVAIKNL